MDGTIYLDYIATNPDFVCPTWYGFVPDCGSVSEKIENAVLYAKDLKDRYTVLWLYYDLFGAELDI